MPKIIKIKDNDTKIKKESLSDVNSIVDKILDKTLSELEDDGIFVFPENIKEAEDLSDEQKILKKNEDYLCSGNVMGFLGYEDERLIIKSRFYEDQDQDFFLQYLLKEVVDLPNIINLETDANQDDQLFNYLLFMFPLYLKKAMRKGLYKVYIRRQYNDANVKGVIDIARHIKLNTPFIGKIAYNQREFSYDNDLTELVRHTIEYIKGKSYGNKILFKAKDEVSLVVNSTPRYKLYDRQKIINLNLKNRINHAFYKEYRDLQRLCLLILRHQKNQIGYGSHKIYGILFDGSWLWEEHVNNLISDKFHHPNNRRKEGAQKLFSKYDDNKEYDGKEGTIYPDFISKGNNIIADAKYKPIDNIKRTDYLQILAYMFRFDAKTGYFLYPESGSEDDKKLIFKLNKGSTFDKNVSPRDDIHVTKHGLKIPGGVDSYEAFEKEMKINERKFKAKLEESFICN